MKKLISALTALAVGCVFTVSAMAADEPARMSMQVDMSHVYIEDATIEVGDTYTWSYDAEAGPVDYSEQGTALRNDYSQPNDQGGLTLVYTAVAPGTHTFRIVNRWWTESYKTVTVTVEEATSTQEPETPAEEPEKPVEKPDGPANEGETSVDEDQTLTDEDQTLTDEDQTLTDEEQTPADEDKTQADEDKTLADEDQTPADEDQTPADEDEAPADEDQALTDEDQAPVDEEQTPTDEDQTPASEDGTPADEDQVPVDEEQVQVMERPVAVPSPDEHGEIAEAIADGTWGAEYTTCPACGYHNWTASPRGYVCDTCGYITASVKTSAGVRGYVDPAAVVKAAAPVTEADVIAAQKANDAYLASIADLQAQIAQCEAAYLASLQG